ncbi:MAG: GTPase ObgE [Chitinispirillia bacterium]|jgi:GTP-binding protein
MFIDETVIKVKAGNGGNGCFSYHREKYVPRGKPNGGNGGRGGHIYIQGSEQLNTLQDISYHRSYIAGRGEHGKGSDKYGKKGKDIVIPIPLGTTIIDVVSGRILFDCVKPGKKFILARGGRGGRGNAALVTRKNLNPEQAEFGKQGQEYTLRLILKVLADVGLVGRPNAGKSTFLSVVSQAHPKIADYPFTTLEPNLGIVTLPDTFHSFVIADIPGLIEGSNRGKGLGIKFLKHIERTRILAIMVEATVDDPVSEAEILLYELNQYSAYLAEKPKCFILTKTDLLPEQKTLNIPNWFCISSVTRKGITDVLFRFKEMIDSCERID